MNRVLCCLLCLGALSAFSMSALGGETQLSSVRVASGLIRPIFATHAPGDYTRLFVIEKAGVIKILNLKTGVVNATPFLDINSLVGGGNSTNDERGLLGLAFHPNYQENGFFYVDYTNNSNNTTIRRYSVSANPDIADSGSGTTLLTIIQPFTNHNGGWLGFGPNDGYLYIGTGDGGSSCDPSQRAQDITAQLLGKLLRIDVDGGPPYGIPPDNPFVGVTGDDEIWAFGLRNPWRPSFDRLTGDLYIADVGQFTWEEINFQSADSAGGENYGWDCTEGLVCPAPGCAAGACGCADSDLVDPFHVYSHSSGCSITGGYVYRGCAIPDLQGDYFFADYCSATIWSGEYNGSGFDNFQVRTTELAPGGGLSIASVTSFGEDERGELYICDQNGGEVFKIIPRLYSVPFTELTCDLSVGVEDLLVLLGEWSPDCDGCISDVNGDGMVNVEDLLDLLADWGPVVE